MSVLKKKLSLIFSNDIEKVFASLLTWLIRHWSM